MSTDVMLSILQPIVDEMRPQMEAHWQRWSSEYAQALNIVPSDGAEALAYWQQRIDRLYDTLQKRPGILQEQVQDEFILTDEQMASYFGIK